MPEITPVLTPPQIRFERDVADAEFSSCLCHASDTPRRLAITDTPLTGGQRLSHWLPISERLFLMPRYRGAAVTAAADIYCRLPLLFSHSHATLIFRHEQAGFRAPDAPRGCYATLSLPRH